MGVRYYTEAIILKGLYNLTILAEHPNKINEKYRESFNMERCGNGTMLFVCFVIVMTESNVIKTERMFLADYKTKLNYLPFVISFKTNIKIEDLSPSFSMLGGCIDSSKTFGECFIGP